MKKLLILAFILPAIGCAGIGEPGTETANDAPEATAQADEPLIDSASHAVIVTTPTATCSGTLINNNWILTDKACKPTASSQTVLTKYKYAPRSPAEVVLHPNRDFALLRVAVPYSLWSDTTTFRQPLFVESGATSLTGRILSCYSAEAALAGRIRVNSEWNTGTGDRRFNFSAVDSTPLKMKSNEGAYCLFNSLGGPQYVGIVKTMWGTTGGEGVPLNDIRPWALGKIYPNQRLVCHGLECTTNPSLLPDNVNETLQWEPCGGLLKGVEGQYSWDATFDFENNYDYLSLTKGAWNEKLTGVGSLSRYPSIPSGGNSVTSVQLYTDSSFPSPGLTNMRAKCMNAVVNAGGSVDASSVANMTYTWQAGPTGGGGGCQAGYDATKAMRGCGLVISEPETIVVTCTATNYPTRKVSSITTFRPGTNTTTTTSCNNADTCSKEFSIDGGVRATCNFTS